MESMTEINLELIIHKNAGGALEEKLEFDRAYVVKISHPSNCTFQASHYGLVRSQRLRHLSGQLLMPRLERLSISVALNSSEFYKHMTPLETEALRNMLHALTS